MSLAQALTLLLALAIHERDLAFEALEDATDLDAYYNA